MQSPINAFRFVQTMPGAILVVISGPKYCPASPVLSEAWDGEYPYLNHMIMQGYLWKFILLGPILKLSP